MADAGTKGDGWLKFVYWTSVSVVIINMGLLLFDLLSEWDYRRPWWMVLLTSAALAVVVAFGFMPGWWERARLRRK